MSNNELSTRKKYDVLLARISNHAESVNFTDKEYLSQQMILFMADLSTKVKEHNLFELLLECEDCDDGDFNSVNPVLKLFGLESANYSFLGESKYLCFTAFIEEHNEDYYFDLSVAEVEVKKDEIWSNETSFANVNIGDGGIKIYSQPIEGERHKVNPEENIIYKVITSIL